MNKTVAIIGSHTATRTLFDYSREDVDVWVFNEAFREDWVERADGAFQLHNPTIWRSKTNRNDPKHYERLTSGDTPVMFMQEQYEDVPKAERYPIEAVKELCPRAYFTSSVSYAIALAIHKGYRRIELYGVEMETNTEYAHQRPGVAYWIGFAEGRGIEVEHFSQGFWNTPMYAYEDDVKIPMSVYEERIEHLTEPCEKVQQAHTEYRAHVHAMLDAWIQSYKADLSQLDDLIRVCGQTAANFGAYDGAKQVNERYLAKCKAMQDETGDYLIVRQEFEGQMIAGGKQQTEHTEAMKEIAAELKDQRQKLNTNDNKTIRELLAMKFKSQFDKYVEENTRLGMGNGIAIENMNLMKYFDSLANGD